MDAGREVVYPVTVIAAISVTVFSLFGIAVMTGFLPVVQSQRKAEPASRAESQSRAIAGVAPLPSAQSSACDNCAVIESIRVREVHAAGVALAATAVDAAGGLPGNHVGNGGTVATVVSAASGVDVGNNVKRGVKKNTYYIIRLRLKDGTYRIIFDQSEPRVNVGESVKLTDGTIIASGDGQLHNP